MSILLTSYTLHASARKDIYGDQKNSLYIEYGFFHSDTLEMNKYKGKTEK